MPNSFVSARFVSADCKFIRIPLKFGQIERKHTHEAAGEAAGQEGLEVRKFLSTGP
jgi:hypothetical protein